MEDETEPDHTLVCDSDNGPPSPYPSPRRKLTTFHQFSQLPTEIRSMIWKFATPQCPEFMRVSPYVAAGVGFSPDRWIFEVEDIYNHTGMLLACRDSRAVALEKLPNRLPTENRHMEIRFDRKVTTLLPRNRAGAVVTFCKTICMTATRRGWEDITW
jgi:hypothetical protein